MSEQEQQSGPTNPQVRVASYSNTTWQGGWRQRSRAFWGTGMFGVLWGAGLGTLLAVPTILAGGTALAIAAPIVAMAGAGFVIGAAIADSVGAAAGAVGAGLGEWESRFKQMMVEAGVFSKDMVQKEPVSAALNRTEMVDTPEEVNLRGHMFKSIINVKAMITFVALGAIFGGALAGFGVLSAGGTIMGLAMPLGTVVAELLPLAPAVATDVAAIISGAVLCGGLASVFGVNSPVISNHLNNFFSKIFSGEFFTGEKKKEQIGPAPEAVQAGGDAHISERERMMLNQIQRFEHAPHRSFQERLEAEKSAPQAVPQIH